MIITCGDALFDIFAAPGGTLSSMALVAHAGGSPLNVAVALSRLGRPTAFLSKISTDHFGGKLMAYLVSEGVALDFVIRTDEPTTLAIIALDGSGVPAYAFYINGTADRSLKVGDLPARLPDAVRAVHIGSYATALEPTATSLEALVTRERPRRFISYDPNIRHSIASDPELWRRRVSALSVQSHLVKASVEDIQFLYPGASVERVLEDWLGRGSDIAIATMGGAGAIALTRHGAAARIRSYSVKVVDTVAAGDTFQAALLAWLDEHGALSAAGLGALSNSEVESLLRFAARAAAITCSRRGADMPRRNELP